MEEQSIWTAIITLITVLGGGSAWRFYEKRAMKRDRDEDFMIAKIELPNWRRYSKIRPKKKMR
jgi:hypothetical protein